MDFDLTPYCEIRSALLEFGIQCQVNGRHQISVSAQRGPIWPDGGNSFWITRATGAWRLFTWSPVGYRVPEDADLVALCRRCMALGTTAMYRVPPEVCEEFGLVEMDDAAADVVYEAMETAD